MIGRVKKILGGARNRRCMFVYEALTKEGAHYRDAMEALNSEEIISTVRSFGHYPVQVDLAQRKRGDVDTGSDETESEMLPELANRKPPGDYIRPIRSSVPLKHMQLTHLTEMMAVNSQSHGQGKKRGAAEKCPA